MGSWSTFQKFCKEKCGLEGLSLLYLKDLESLRTKNFWYETLNYIVTYVYNDPKKNDQKKIKVLISVNYEMMCYCLNDTDKIMSVAKDLTFSPLWDLPKIFCI